MQNLFVFGASNVARNLSTIIYQAQQSLGSPLNFYAAFGHGRSLYGTSNVLGHALPGILNCQIWNALPDPSEFNYAVITDVGNDLLYEHSVEQISVWLRECIDRISRRTKNIAISELPVANCRRLGKNRFLFLRSIFFPGCRLPLEEIVSRSEALNQNVLNLANEYSIHVIQPREHWYAFDPIHYKRSKAGEAWNLLLSPFHDRTAEMPTRIQLTDRVRLRFLRFAHTKHIFGIRVRGTQPTIRLLDQTAVHWY